VLRALPFSLYSPRHRHKHGHRRPPHSTRNHSPPTHSERLPSARVSVGRHTANCRAVGQRVATPHHRRARATTGASMVHVTVRETRSPALASGGAVVAGRGGLPTAGAPQRRKTAHRHGTGGCRRRRRRRRAAQWPRSCRRHFYKHWCRHRRRRRRRHRQRQRRRRRCQRGEVGHAGYATMTPAP